MNSTLQKLMSLPIGFSKWFFLFLAFILEIEEENNNNLFKFM